MFTDTHCHIHESTYPYDPDETIARAQQGGVSTMICVVTSQQSSQHAVDFVQNRESVYASVGVHPHETKDGYGRVGRLLDEKHHKIVAVGEIGLDYFYTHSPRGVQIMALEAQIDMALKANLPIIFHVREAFDDFWPIFDNFHGIRGELHSFTDTAVQLEQGLTRGLSIGVNGISTFTKDVTQRHMFSTIPLDRLLLETDAPFLTPVPFRGKVNEPAFVVSVAKFHAEQRGLQLEQIAKATTTNAQRLFAL